MRNKRKYIILSVSIIILIFICLFAWLIYEDDKQFAVPNLPASSKAGQLIVTSDGCCFYIKDITVSIVTDTKTEKIVSIGELYEHDIYSNNITNELSGNIDVEIKFSFYYGDEGTVTIPVMEFENIEALKKQGLLLAFEERDGMYLVVKSKKDKITFKMNDGKWSEYPHGTNVDTIKMTDGKEYSYLQIAPDDGSFSFDDINIYTATADELRNITKYDKTTGTHIDLSTPKSVAATGADILNTVFDKWTESDTLVVCKNETANAWIIHGQLESRESTAAGVGIAVIDIKSESIVAIAYGKSAT